MNNIEIIKSLENKKVKKYTKLLQKKYREEEKEFLVVGDHLVSEAYKANNLLEVIKTEDNNICLDVPTTYVTYDIIKKISGMANPQSIIGICKMLPPSNIGNRILMLDDIQDPGNLGTIIRSSVAFNIDTIVLSSHTVDLYNDKTIRASEGMLFNINILKKDILTYIDELKNNNYKIYGTNVNGGKLVDDLELPDKYVIIVGNEGSGVKEEILAKCDEYFYVPMNAKCESLNVGVATSIILYELDKNN